ncbi:hypothetical protein Hdeb2414_s0002g00054991 [Helianthus debilis subsp. tardiflorus]
MLPFCDLGQMFELFVELSLRLRVNLVGLILFSLGLLLILLG